MGLLSKTAQVFGLRKSSQQQKNVGASAGAATFNDIFSGGGSGAAPSFTNFNGMRQQMSSYYDWVYAAASRVAEECSCIDIELYINRTKQKNLTVGRRLATSPARVRKYMEAKTTDIYTKNGKVHVKANVPKLELVENHELTDLLDHPNKFMSGVEFFELTFLHLELTGNAFWAIIRDGSGKPMELWPLYPNYMRIVPHETDFITGYVYTINGEQIPFEPQDIVHHKYSNPNDLRWGMSTVMAAARAIDTDTMAADYNRKFFYNSAQPDAVLYTDEFIDEKTWTRIKDQFQDMYGGTANAHKTAILENGLKYQAMNPNQREMEFLKSREFNRDMILAMFGVPKSVIGLDASMSRANAETAEYVFAKGTLRPKFLRLVTGIQEKLAPQFDERLVVSFVDPVPEDKEFKQKERKELVNVVLTINEVREEMGYEPVADGDRLYIPNTMRELGAPAASTLPTKPTDTDEEPENDEDIQPGGDEGNGGDSNTDDDNGGGDEGGGAAASTSDQGAAEKAVRKSALPVEDGCVKCKCCNGFGEHYDTGYECYRCDAGGSVTPTEDKEPIPCDGRADSPNIWVDENGDYRHASEKKAAGSKKKLAPKTKAAEDYEDLRNEIADAYEPKMHKAVLAHMRDQEKEVLANVDKRLKSLQKGEGKRVIKANLDNLFDPKDSQNGWLMRLGVLFEKMIGIMGVASMKQLEEELGDVDLPPYDKTNPSIKQFYTDRIRRVSVYFDEETQKQLAATLMEGIDAGESVDGLRKRVHAVYKATQEGDLMWYRAERIARTEPIFATTWGTLDAWKVSGVVIGKEWRVGGQDDLLCIYCRNMDGKQFMNDLDGAWYETGDSMTVTDDKGNKQTMKFSYVDVIGPPLHPNCRCTLLPIIKN